ncbi:ATP-binding cassette domain-containing protein, partial [Parabacteroides distasonis]
NLGRHGVFESVSFEVRAGEVLGLSGLMGAGRTEVARCIFGLDKYDSGSVWLNGQQLKIRSPKEALKYGICYVSEDRQREGIIPLRSLKENISLADLEQICT